MFRFNQTIIMEPTVCASLKLQYWRQLKYLVIELSGHVAAHDSSPVGVFVSCTVHSETVKINVYWFTAHCHSLCTVHDTHTNRTGLTFKNRASYI
jgi:hypothetical protein